MWYGFQPLNLDFSTVFRRCLTNLGTRLLNLGTRLLNLGTRLLFRRVHNAPYWGGGAKYKLNNIKLFLAN